MHMFNGAVPRSLAAALVVLPALSVSGLVAAQSSDAEEEPGLLYVYASADGASVPGGGSDEGYADFSARFDTKAGEICYVLDVADVEATAAHIHEGNEGAVGAAVVTLEVTGADEEKCTAVDAKLARRIGGKPDGYYVNIHTAEFPGGALRGQLEN